MKENFTYHFIHNTSYRKIVKGRKVSPNKIKGYEDLHKIPCIPTSLLKQHNLKTRTVLPTLHATSSGTSGQKSHIYYDIGGLMAGLKMVLRFTKFHKLRSLQPTHYIMLGSRPSKENQTILSKTQFGCTMFAPALSRTYVLNQTKSGYEIDMEGVFDRLRAYTGKEKKLQYQSPVRIIGMPRKISWE